MGTSEDASALPKRRSVYEEEEQIEVKPATELIPDEYENTSNDKVLLHVFISGKEDRNIADGILVALKDVGYNVDQNENLHRLETAEDFDRKLKMIKDATKNKNALVLFFIGAFKREGTLLLRNEEEVEIKRIWNYFSADNCPELKNKPKIFIICGTKVEKIAQIDSAVHYTTQYDDAYDFPAESDLLIVFKRIENTKMLGARDDFFYDLCYHIKENGRTYDMIDLILQAQNGDNESIPLIISTLTSKFYLIPSQQREHYLLIAENLTDLKSNLKSVKEKVSTLHTISNKPKKSSRLFNFPSFSKNKNEDKPKIAVKSPEPKRKENERPGKVSADSPSKVANAPIPPRTKTISTSSDFDRKNVTRASADKPRWRH